MAKVSFVSIPVGLENQYSQVLEAGDRFAFAHVKVKRLFSSRVRKKGMSQKSLFPILSPVWAGFSDAERLAWGSAGDHSHMSGWRLFVQDTSGRIANGISGYATPSDLYQSRVGRMTVVSPAVGLKIEQLHPQTYFVNHKIAGTKSQYVPVQVIENLTLPVSIAISYKSNLVGAGASPRARFFINVYSSYQGNDLENLCVIDFDLVHDWERKTASISGVVGKFRGYTAYVEIYNARGDLFFDNVDIIHGGINFARDPFCNSIQTTFTKAFYQIPRNWIATGPVTDTFYRSVYHDA